jgi:hypothetical protein
LLAARRIASPFIFVVRHFRIAIALHRMSSSATALDFSRKKEEEETGNKGRANAT